MPAMARRRKAVAAAIEALRDAIAAGLDRGRPADALPPGAARNALDCAFWDLEAKAAKPARYELRGIAAAAAAHHRFHDLHRHA